MIFFNSKELLLEENPTENLDMAKTQRPLLSQLSFNLCQLVTCFFHLQLWPKKKVGKKMPRYDVEKEHHDPKHGNDLTNTGQTDQERTICEMGIHGAIL